MDFDPNNFREVVYGERVLYFDKVNTFHTYFQHKQKTTKFPYYRNILNFLEENLSTKIYFTLDSSVESFEKTTDGFVINMAAYQQFCKTIASKTGGRFKAFLGQNVRLENVSFSEIEKAEFIAANATETGILEAIKTLPAEKQTTMLTALNALLAQSNVAIGAAQTSPTVINPEMLIKALSSFLLDKSVQDAFFSQLPKIQINVLRSHVAFLRENLDKNETFIENWIDEDGGKYRRQRCLIFGLDYVDPIREGQVSAKRFDILAKQDLESHVIFELKSPKDEVFKINVVPVVAGGISSEYNLSPALARAIPEVLGYKKFYEDANAEELEKLGIKVKKRVSKCVIVIGTRLDDQVWKDNFDRVCRTLNGIELLTYTHLIERLENTIKNLEEHMSVIGAIQN